ncbi:Sensor histidine kinase RcsC [Alphaproteobacteria bacterium SO-S41]|nr:Sensor histidine kinase RcsC [Alphaproteobacteria bacterium SO-S41]
MDLKTLTASLALIVAHPALAIAQTTVPVENASLSAFDQSVADAKSVMMADPDVALGHARRATEAALALPEGNARTIAGATARWLEGEALSRLNRPGEAEPIIQEALASITAAAPGSKLNGDLLMSRAAISAMTGRIQEALADFQAAHNIFQTIGAKRSQAIALQNIGSIYSDAGDYPRVLDYYDQSAEVYSDDPALSISAHNNRGNAYKELGEFAKAESEFKTALELAVPLKSPLLQVRIMTNVASVQFLHGQLGEADMTAEKALGIAQAGPAAGWAPYLWGVRAQVAFGRGDTAMAAALIDKTFDGIDLSKTTMPFRDFHKAAHEIFKARGELAKALAHFEAYKRLDDEARALNSSTNAALMGAQFDSANQKLAISDLKAGQLQRDKAIADSNARFQMLLLWSVLGGSAILIGLSLGAFFSVRRSRNATHALNIQLNAANLALEKAVKARTEFLAMTSHEIRTPLNGILGMAQVVLLDETLTAEQRENIGLVRAAGETMRMLVDDILDIAKMEAGRLMLEERDFPLTALFNEVGGLARGQAEAKGLTIEIKTDNCPQRWVGDEQRLRQIVFNLMSNAVKFTQEGSVTLSVREVSFASGTQLVITVEDTGVGIAAESLGRIFESFQQADTSITRRFGGTGLGLAICEKLVQAMRGTIRVESDLGWGSTFTVTIPRVATAAQELLVDTGTGASSVLLAEPNLLRLSILEAQLMADGFHVITADQAEDALVLAGSQRFSYAVVSGEMLDVQTVEGLGRLKTLRAVQPDARLLVLSRDDVRNDGLLRQCGADVIASALIAPKDLGRLLMGEFLYNSRTQPDSGSIPASKAA